MMWGKVTKSTLLFFSTLCISLFASNAAFAQTSGNKDAKTNVVVDVTEAQEDIVEENATEAQEDVVEENATEAEEDIVEETVTEAIHLQHYMTTSMRQGDYGSLAHGGCCAMSYAVGLSIVKQQNVNPTQFFYGGLAHYDWGGIGGAVSYNAKSIYEALKDGKPTMIHYYYTGNSGQHWVLITGIEEGIDLDSISYGDFTAIDPATGEEGSLTSVWKFNSSGVVEIRIFN